MKAVSDGLVKELRRQAAEGASVPDLLRHLHIQLGPDAAYSTLLAKYFMAAFDLPLRTVSPIGGWSPDGKGEISDARIQELIYPAIKQMPEPTTAEGPSQTPARPFPWFCPKCRRKEVRRVTMPYQCERLHNGQPITIALKNFSVPRCGNCGELVFDYEAEEQITQANMTPLAPPAIATVSRLLAATDGLRICFDPPADPATDGAFDSLPLELHPELTNYLKHRFPEGLFRHQRAAYQHVLAGQHTVVATRTNSGKSLIYSIPVLDRLLTEPDSTALFLFPQKALANDQLQGLNKTVDELPSLAGLRATRPHLIARYDGATQDDLKPRIRAEVQVLLTNPDMLHYAVLAWHEKHWGRFLSRLRYVVVDECHEYRGIFGTNVSYLFRRLRALCCRYGSSPTFIATSATVQSPPEHLKRLTGLPFACVGPDVDGSRQGERKFWMVRPEEHPYDAGRKITLALAEAGLTVLTFCLSRTAAERMMARSGRENKDTEPPFVRVYRAGLTAAEREEIERELRDRTVRAVFSTSALELGIDIGAIDAVVCVGLPTTMMSLWQRAGRAGRAGKQGAIILIPGQTPIDAWYVGFI